MLSHLVDLGRSKIKILRDFQVFEMKILMWSSMIYDQMKTILQFEMSDENV